MVDSNNVIDEKVDFQCVGLPIGMARVQGLIEDFYITIYDRNGITYNYKVVGGNICACENEYTEHKLEYEVR